MLGYTVATTAGQGEGDGLLALVADALSADGWLLAGVVQSNSPAPSGHGCLMDLTILGSGPGSGERVRISQHLGTGARGCRLDPAGLAAAVGLVERQVAAGARLLIVNKFGKEEAGGRGFRTLIGRALADGLPVLTAVSQRNLAAFEDFAGGFGSRLPAEDAALLNWCRSVAPG